MSFVIDGLSFREENIHMDDGMYSAERAYALVAEKGIPFREAYRQVAKKYAE